MKIAFVRLIDYIENIGIFLLPFLNHLLSWWAYKFFFYGEYYLVWYIMVMY